MGVSYTDRSSIRFGDFELDLQTGVLRKNGTRIRCQEQPLQVLAALAERPGELVTREELRRRVWPQDTFVDFDHALNTRRFARH
jgi:DNA-binding winged helix-turn-helix (wHTH) protein